MLLSVLVLTFVLGAIRPLFNALTMLLVLDPIADVCRSVRMLVGATPVGFVIAPGSFVNVAIGVHENSVTIRLVVPPLAVVPAPVLPNLLTVAIFHSLAQFTSVNSTITQGNWPVVLPILIVQYFTRDSNSGHRANRGAAAVLIENRARCQVHLILAQHWKHSLWYSILILNHLTVTDLALVRRGHAFQPIHLVGSVLILYCRRLLTSKVVNGRLSHELLVVVVS